MATHFIWRTIAVVLAWGLAEAACSQMRPSAPESAATVAPAKVSAEALKGTWVRPGGGYRIVIQGVGADAKLNAMYFNPAQLPFARAQFSQDGATFRVALERQAGGYAGSTSDLL